MPARIQVINEACHNHASGARLCFQWCLYVFEDGTSENGYRFIWRRTDGSLQPSRGQARIPSIEILNELVKTAKKEGWGDYEAE